MVVQDNKELISAVEDNVGDAVVDSNGNHGEERVSASENSSSNSEHSDEEPEENDLIRWVVRLELTISSQTIKTILSWENCQAELQWEPRLSIYPIHALRDPNWNQFVLHFTSSLLHSTFL